MKRCHNCNMIINDGATKCRYCYATQLPELDAKTVLLSTTNSIGGYEVIEHYGFVFGEVVCPNGILGALTKGTFFTISALSEARSEALNALSEKAKKLGANAVVGLDVDICDLNGNGVLVSANGTAVYVIPGDMRKRISIIENEKEEIEKERIANINRIEQEREEKYKRIQEYKEKCETGESTSIRKFFDKARACDKYSEIGTLWSELGLDKIEIYEEINQKIKGAIQTEKSFGSRKDRILKEIDKWENSILEGEK